MFADSSFGATVSEFRLDKYEVTVGRFRQFVTAGKGTQASPPPSGSGAHPKLAGSGWDASWNASLVTDVTALLAALKCSTTYVTWTDAPGGNESRPMTCLTWYEAMAFCTWDGGFLPSEAEWNYAASGGLEQRAYPWSSPPGALSIDDTRASWNCNGDGVLSCTAADLVAVGTNPAGDGRWGHSDLAGNVWEWTLDWKRSPYATPCTDCAELDSSLGVHVVRGGSFGDAAQDMRAGARGTVRPPVVREIDIGFRCARTP
jgi:formylglycine-generating enzyme required for sulfatase activity